MVQKHSTKSRRTSGIWALVGTVVICSIVMCIAINKNGSEMDSPSSPKDIDPHTRPSSPEYQIGSIHTHGQSTSLSLTSSTACHLPPHGIINLSASCFFASTVQTLLSIPEVIQYFRQGYFNDHTQPLSAAFQDFIIDYTRKTPVNPTNLIKAISMKSPELKRMFERSIQEDAEGLLLHIVDELKTECELGVSLAGGEGENPFELFYGKGLNTKLCGLCKGSILKAYPYSVVPLEINESVQASVNRHFPREKAETEEISERCCPACKQIGPFDEINEILTVPKYLGIRVQNNHLFKLNQGATIDEAILVDGQRYELIGMMVRTGKTTVAGHYTTYCKRDKWCKFNDSVVTVNPKVPAHIGNVTTVIYARAG